LSHGLARQGGNNHARRGELVAVWLCGVLRERRRVEVGVFDGGGPHACVAPAVRDDGADDEEPKVPGQEKPVQEIKRFCHLNLVAGCLSLPSYKSAIQGATDGIRRCRRAG